MPKPKPVKLGRGKLWFYFSDLLTVDVSAGVPKIFSWAAHRHEGEIGTLLWQPDPPKGKRGKKC